MKALVLAVLLAGCARAPVKHGLKVYTPVGEPIDSARSWVCAYEADGLHCVTAAEYAVRHGGD